MLAREQLLEEELHSAASQEVATRPVAQLEDSLAAEHQDILGMEVASRVVAASQVAASRAA